MNTELTRVSRRSFVTAAGGAAVGLGLGRVAGPAQAAEALPPLPWTTYYRELDPDDVRRRAYCLYYQGGGCGHGAGQALIGALGDALADEGIEPNVWRLLPVGLYRYASGGVAGWGTICGSLNAAVGVMGLLGVYGKVGNALMDYFSTAELPTDALVGYVPPAGVPAPLPAITKTVSGSPLCHVSVSSWAAAAGVPVSDPSKSDRCARLVGDVVAKAAELMNLAVLNGASVPWTAPAGYAACYDCHTKAQMVPSEVGRMDCNGCHDVVSSHDYRRKRRGRSGH